MKQGRGRPVPSVHVPAATPLDPDELDACIPTHLETQEELNAWEAENIGQAMQWLAGKRAFDPLTVDALKDLHRHMFDHTWRWAGKFRKRMTNISPVPPEQVAERLENLVRNYRSQYESSEKTAEALDELALRFYHELVHVHPWPNGNGRHARLATDLLLKRWSRPSFSWGRENISATGEARDRYVSAVKAADGGEYRLLRRFVRS